MTSPTPPTVLVVDDDGSLCRLLGVALRRHGFRTVIAGGVEEARRALGEQPGIDVVVLDGMLPDGHGLDVAAGLLTDGATAALPICVLSGTVRRRLPSSAGITCVAKPAGIADVVGALRELLAWRDAGGSPPSERQAAIARIRAGATV